MLKDTKYLSLRTRDELTIKLLGSLSGVIRRNHVLKSLRTFGPFFRISFDLTLTSFLPGQDGLSNILSFNAAGQTPVLQINVNNVGRLDFGIGKNF